MHVTDHSGDLPLIVLDCDGVLVDSERLLQRVDVAMLTELGWPITTDEIYREHLGHTVADMVANVERHLGTRLPADFLERRNDRFTALLDAELRPVPGIIAALNRLDQMGYTTCVASSGSHEKMRMTLGRVGIFDRFEGRIFSAHDVSKGKPWPELFLHASQRMGYPPDRCIVIEDSPAGITAAYRAGMLSIGYAAQTPTDMLADADATIEDMGDLVETVARLSRSRRIGNHSAR
ncbi:HAD family hydrolase [Gryllotalpicola reticulitermitis]|uniref:HAD family hydrolase n=1 Tax=Gryllotalpicola reticulitermitis TaxID=1184153 RepID=A0ABV8QBK7_9MICO